MSDRIGPSEESCNLNVFMDVMCQAGSREKAAERLHCTKASRFRDRSEELYIRFGVARLASRPKAIEPTEMAATLLACGLAVFDDLRQGVGQSSLFSSESYPVGVGRFGANDHSSRELSIYRRLIRSYCPSSLSQRIVFRVLVTGLRETLHR